MESTQSNAKKRLHYGVVLHSLDNTLKFNLLQGIQEFAEENDINLTAYFGSYAANNYEVPSHYEPCFEAINKTETMDGVVFFSGFVANGVGNEAIIECMRSVGRKIPLISIGIQADGIYSVVMDNKRGMYSATEHLIKQHGKKRIVFITGPAGHPEAEDRFQGYKQALEDNGIAFDDSLVARGSFSPSSGREAMTDIIENRKVSFDAVAACDDDTAFGAVTYLKQKGIRVPEDAAVVGFNDVEEAARYSPSLSSVKQDFSQLGVYAVKMLHDIIRGKSANKVNLIAPEFIMRHSCGCKPDTDKLEGSIYEILEDNMFRRRVMDNIVVQFDIESLADELHRALPQISITSAVIGLYNNPIDGCSAEGDRSVTMLTGFCANHRIDIKNNTSNPFPFTDYSSIAGFDFSGERQTLFFLPLIFADEELGVLLISYNGSNPIGSYEILRRNVSTAVKGANLLEKIRLLSITDELTGLLNRRGFFQLAHARILFLQRERSLFPAVLSIDMDGLKHINDTYGHAEGDTAILAFSKMLKDALREEDIIGRVGGDEFIVLSAIKSNDDISKLADRINEKLDIYNARNLHPYKIAGSIGATTLDEPTYDALDRAMLDADNEMYEQKEARKRADASSGA